MIKRMHSQYFALLSFRMPLHNLQNVVRETRRRKPIACNEKSNANLYSAFVFSLQIFILRLYLQTTFCDLRIM